MDRAEIETTHGGPLPEDPAYRGQRLGLPESGPGSMATLGRRVVALFIDWFAAMIISRALVGTPESTLESFATLGIFALEVTLLTWLWGSSFGQRIVASWYASAGTPSPTGAGLNTTGTPARAAIRIAARLAAAGTSC